MANTPKDPNDLSLQPSRSGGTGGASFGSVRSSSDTKPGSGPTGKPDFSNVVVPAAGAAPRPDVFAHAEETHPLTTSLVRVLDEEHRAVGPWNPKLDAETLRKILRDMVTVRAFDDACTAPNGRGRPAST